MPMTLTRAISSLPRQPGSSYCRADPFAPSGTSRSVHPHHQPFSRSFRSDVFFADDFSHSRNAGHIAKLHFYSFRQEVGTKYQRIAFELTRLHHAAWKSISEHVRLVGLLLGIPRHDQQPFKITHCAMGMETIHNRISTWAWFAGVNSTVASALRIERCFGVRFRVVPGAKIQFLQAVHLRRSHMLYVLPRYSTNRGWRRSHKREETQPCCETIASEKHVVHVSLLC